MAFTIDESFLPATLTAPPMTDEQFAEFCSEHPDLFFEMTAEGEIIVMAPTFSMTAMRNSKIIGQLDSWADQDARGVTFDSSGGFVLPNRARRSADVSWGERNKIKQRDADGRKGFFHLCPDFVIELKSDTDRLPTLRKKMTEWIANGAQLAWLINPDNQTVEIYRPNRAMETITNPKSIAAESPVRGFVLDLTRVWDPLGDRE
jgi:Uma2 family endonuclease